VSAAICRRAWRRQYSEEDIGLLKATNSVRWFVSISNLGITRKYLMEQTTMDRELADFQRPASITSQLATEESFEWVNV
jgi:hypothetical protein